MFNLDTKATGMSVGIWLLRATLSDGSQHFGVDSAQVAVRSSRLKEPRMFAVSLAVGAAILPTWF